MSHAKTFNSAQLSQIVAFRNKWTSQLFLPTLVYSRVLMLTTRHSAFTLIELLVTISIIAILAVLALPSYNLIHNYYLRSACASNMQQLGMAFIMYAGENDQTLPGRVTGKDASGQPLDKWPAILWNYLHTYKVYVDPGNPKAVAIPPAQLISNSSNKGSFFFNGFNDLGALNDPSIHVNLNNLTDRSAVLLLGQKKTGDGSYYMDLLEGPHGNQNDVLNKTAYGTGSIYVFSDGSARFISLKDYSDTLWLANKDFVIPKL